jgi:hypothetical protein
LRIRQSHCGAPPIIGNLAPVVQSLGKQIMSDAEFPPTLEFVFAAQVSVDRPLELGDVGKGGRRIVRPRSALLVSRAVSRARKRL